MKIFFWALLLCLCVWQAATASRTMYIGATNGLSLRSAPKQGQNIITRINYGETVKVDSMMDAINVDGFASYWAAINYNDTIGFVVRAYLLPVPPPAKTVDDLKKYAGQLSAANCKPIINSEKYLNAGYNKTHEKHVYENGAVYTVYNDYEYFSESLMLPDVSLQEAFVIAGNIPLLKVFLPKDMKFPLVDKKEKTAGGGYRQVNLDYDEHLRGNYKTLSKIHFAGDESMAGSLSFIRLNGHVMIVFEYGS